MYIKSTMACKNCDIVINQQSHTYVALSTSALSTCEQLHVVSVPKRFCTCL